MSDTSPDQPEDSGHGDPPPKKPPARIAIPPVPVTSPAPESAPAPTDEEPKK